MQKKPLRILPLGGVGEIGMNCLVLEWDSQIVLVDCGIQFPDASYSGVDLLLPDLTYVRERLDKLLGIVVTHGHDDHIGAIPFLARDKELKVYATPFPRGLIQQKMTEHEEARKIDFVEIRPREKFTVGPFTFDPIPVQHSIIEALGFAVETPVGTIVHTGDFKHDPKDERGEVIGFGPFAEWGKKGVRLLLSDSTNAERLGHTLSEDDITSSFEGILSKQTGRVLIALFASNIRRLESLLGIAKKLGKKVALAGRSMHGYTKLAHEQSSMNIPEGTLILLENIQSYPDNQVLVLATGSQAEPQSALVRISQGIHKDFQIKNGDLVIMSSRFIPGNEKAISSMIDHIYRQGAEVLYEAIHQIHVSGHGFQEELLMMLEATKPESFIPVHGEYRHLAKHAKLAKQSGVPEQNVIIIEDGQAIELTETSIKLGENFELQKSPVVGGVFMESIPATFTQRVNLGKTGIVFAAAIQSRDKKGLAVAPRIASYGLLYRKGENPEQVMKEAADILEDLCEEKGKDPELLEHIRLELRRYFKKHVSHKPVVLPVLLDA